MNGAGPELREKRLKLNIPAKVVSQSLGIQSSWLVELEKGNALLKPELEKQYRKILNDHK